MKVIDLPDLTEEDFKTQIMASLKDGGWFSLWIPGEAEKHVAQEAAELQRLAEVFPTGTLLEKRGNKFQERR